MAKNTQIEWTHHTFNPWWGCAKVSPACENCYADLWARRMGHKIWGVRAPRRFFKDAHWNEPQVWNAEAQAQKTRHRVFCASMADVFEERRELDSQRERLWGVIKATPWLDWLLLTKRPENISTMVPWREEWPANIWLGTTVENQDYAEERLPFLLKHKASVRFLSCEPLLGSLDLKHWFTRRGFHPIDWVIAGGESGPGARPMHPDWPARLLQQCQAHRVPFHFKQWGHWVPAELVADEEKPKSVVQLPQERAVSMAKLSKKEAGRILQGSTWDEVPDGVTTVHA
jgi:protein gp37